MQKLTSTDDKFMIFTDIHYGNDSDSENFLNENDKVVDWFISSCKERNITNGIFAGDFFHKQYSVDVATHNRGYDAIKRIVDAGITLYFIIGNHDIYMKNSVEINSVKPFKEIKGLHLIDKMTELIAGKRKLLLVPWLGNPFETLLSSVPKKYDCIIGHIEMKDVQMTQDGGMNSVEKKGYVMTDMFDVSPVVFIGHYHIKKDYKFEKGLVRSLGCPLQESWGDQGLTKGIWYFDSGNMKTEFIENTFSPKHIEVCYSKFVEKSIDSKGLTGNYIKPVFDLPFEQKDAADFLDYINSNKPLRLEQSKFLYTVTFKSSLLANEEQIDNKECQKLINMPLPDSCMKWIEKKLADNPKKLDMEKMRSIVNSCYSSVLEKRKKKEQEDLA